MWWKKWFKAWRGTTSVKCRWVSLNCSDIPCITAIFSGSSPVHCACFDSPAGSYVQLQRRLLQSLLRLHVSGSSVHRTVSHSSGSSSGTGHLRTGKVSGEGISFLHLCRRCLQVWICSISSPEKKLVSKSCNTCLKTSISVLFSSVPRV